MRTCQSGGVWFRNGVATETAELEERMDEFLGSGRFSCALDLVSLPQGIAFTILIMFNSPMADDGSLAEWLRRRVQDEDSLLYVNLRGGVIRVSVSSWLRKYLSVIF